MNVIRFRKRHAEFIDAVTFNTLTPEQQKAELQRLEAQVRRQAKSSGCDTSELDAELSALDEDLAATLSGIETVADRLRNAR